MTLAEHQSPLVQSLLTYQLHVVFSQANDLGFTGVAPAKTFPARPRSASRRLALPGFGSKEEVNLGHVQCEPLLAYLVELRHDYVVWRFVDDVCSHRILDS